MVAAWDTASVSDNERQPPIRRRREPPPFRKVVTNRLERLSPRLARVTFGGDELEGFEVDQPAASVRLLIPSPGTDELVMPRWDGNLFRLPDGEPATIRTFTPRRLDPEALELDLWIVIHGEGAASLWAEAAVPGQPAAISGPGRGYAVDEEAAAELVPDALPHVVGAPQGEDRAVQHVGGRIRRVLLRERVSVEVDLHAALVRRDPHDVDPGPGRLGERLVLHELQELRELEVEHQRVLLGPEDGALRSLIQVAAIS